MLAQGTMASDENRGLLGHHTQPPDAITSIAPKGLRVYPRSQITPSLGQSDNEIDRWLWDNFEVRRRSADWYMNKYLDCLQGVPDEQSRHLCGMNDSVDAAPPTDVAIQEPHATNRAGTKSRLEISCESLSCDLVAMHETLGQLKRRQLQRRRSVFPIYVSFVASSILSYILCTYAYPWRAAGIFVAANAGIVLCYYSKIWNWHRTIQIGSCQEKVRTLYWSVRRGELGEQNRGNLKEGLLDWNVDSGSV
ncbi:hypothetical protein GGI35DRAFT_447615 [Trichoderma velutinum]